MATTNKIIIGIDDQVIELTGADKEAFIADRLEGSIKAQLLETEYAAKQAFRTSALTKLAEIAGLTEDEMAALGL